MITDKHDLWRIIGDVGPLKVTVGCDYAWPEGTVHIENYYQTVSLDVPDIERLIGLLRDAAAEQKRFAARMKDMGVPPWATNGE